MKTDWVFVSFILWICLMVQVIYVLVLVLFVIWPQYSRLATDKAFQRKHNYLVEMLDFNGNYWAMLYQVSYFVRRIVLPMVAIYLNHYPYFQIFILIGVDLFACVVQCWAWPLNSS